jgi:membrane protein YqaA with SNARE-associated domain
MNKFKKICRQQLHGLYRLVSRPWYPFLLGLLAAADIFLVFLPTDGMLVASIMLERRKWLVQSVFLAIGSTIGALGLAWLTRAQGLPWILRMFPGLENTETWHTAIEYFNDYGSWLVMANAATIFAQQPTIILAGISAMNFGVFTMAFLAGRTLKYFGIGFLGSYAPSVLTRLFGLRGELEDADIPQLRKSDESNSLSD